MKTEKAKLGIQDIWPIALVFIVTGIGVAFGFDITTDVKNDFAEDDCADRTDGYVVYNSTAAQCQSATNGSQVSVDTFAWNATTSEEQALDNLMDKLPTIALVIVAAILITILVRNLGGLGN